MRIDRLTRHIGVLEFEAIVFGFEGPTMHDTMVDKYTSSFGSRPISSSFSLIAFTNWTQRPSTCRIISPTIPSASWNAQEVEVIFGRGLHADRHHVIAHAHVVYGKVTELVEMDRIVVQTQQVENELEP